MCGICGYININEPIEEETTIVKMMDTIKHRGPDDNGYEFFNVFHNYHDVAFGFDRLSILDVSNNGHQPMYDDDRSVCIVYNGEIYNAFDYRKELVERGVRFKSNTDTEILLYLYKEYGIEGMLDRINGMFAFALVDLKRHKLYLVRDRFGVKPLYIYYGKRAILFASEIKAFYAHQEFCNELNADAVGEYMLFRYIAGEETLLKNVYNVLPGDYLEFIDSYTIKKHTYWRLNNNRGEENLSTDVLEEMIEDSCIKRLMSDVNVGVQLSGGIDSSIISLYASRNHKELIESYSIIFDDSLYSEEKWINRASGIIGIRNNRTVFQVDDFCNLIKEATWLLDAPINHPNSIGLYLLCRKAKKKVSVLLSGEGADEIFGGYGRYLRFMWMLMNQEEARQEDYSKGVIRRWNDCQTKFIMLSSFCEISNYQRLIKNIELESSIDRRRILLEKVLKDKDSFEQYLNYDVKTYLVDILNRQDKMSMGASIETRVPFLNYELVEYVRSRNILSYIRPSRLNDESNTKIPLKRIAKKEFGMEFAAREKMGFSLPLDQYYRDNRFRDYISEEILPFLNESPFIDSEELQIMWKESSEKNVGESILWNAIAFGIWGSIFLSDKGNVIS